MKKALSPILLAAVLVFAAVPDRGPIPIYAVGETVGQMSYTHFENSFADVIDRVPILAEVKITKYLGSLKEATRYDATLYYAEIVTCYKNTTGTELSIIQLVQDGTADMTVSGYPLFQTGDRLLLPLAPASYFGPAVAERLSGCYLIDGANLTAMQIVESKDGEVCRTFMPSMLDLPTENLTAAMHESSKQHVMKKHGFVDEKELETIPPYFTVSYERLRSYIKQVLCK